MASAAAAHAAGFVGSGGLIAWKMTSAHVMATRNCAMLKAILCRLQRRRSCPISVPTAIENVSTLGRASMRAPNHRAPPRPDFRGPALLGWGTMNLSTRIVGGHGRGDRQGAV